MQRGFWHGQVQHLQNTSKLLARLIKNFCFVIIIVVVDEGHRNNWTKPASKNLEKNIGKGHPEAI